jgi:hypothetical protein
MNKVGDSIMISRSYEFNVLGVYDYHKSGKLFDYYEWIRVNHHRFDGDILEAGVFRGKSLIATGLLLNDLGSSKKVYGFDSFSGFPPIYSEEDKLKNFEILHAEGRITDDHLLQHINLVRHRRFLKGLDIDEKNISSSESFQDTSIEGLKRKIDYLNLKNRIELVEGDFSDTMVREQANPLKISAALLDCDLYKSYQDSLNFIWPRLEVGGIIFLDEYFSLKFPGARIATDDFFSKCKQKVSLKRVSLEDTFERWVATKLED